MRLNPDCIRNILLTVEELTDFNHYLEYRINANSFDKLSPYTHDEIVYHIRQCELSNLIHNVHYYDGGESIIIQDLTPKGHEFLANIRSNTNWNKTKEIANKVGSTSLDIIIQIASNVISDLVKSQFF